MTKIKPKPTFEHKLATAIYRFYRVICLKIRSDVFVDVFNPYPFGAEQDAIHRVMTWAQINGIKDYPAPRNLLEAFGYASGMYEKYESLPQSKKLKREFMDMFYCSSPWEKKIMYTIGLYIAHEYTGGDHKLLERVIETERKTYVENIDTEELIQEAVMFIEYELALKPLSFVKRDAF